MTTEERIAQKEAGWVKLSVDQTMEIPFPNDEYNCVSYRAWQDCILAHKNQGWRRVV